MDLTQEQYDSLMSRDVNTLSDDELVATSRYRRAQRKAAASKATEPVVEPATPTKVDEVAAIVSEPKAKPEVKTESRTIASDLRPIVSTVNLRDTDAATTTKALDAATARQLGQPPSAEKAEGIMAEQELASRERRSGPTDVTFTEAGANKFSAAPFVGFSTIREVDYGELQRRAPEFLTQSEPVRKSYETALKRAKAANESGASKKILIKFNEDGTVSNPNNWDLLADVTRRQPLKVSVPGKTEFSSEEEKKDYQALVDNINGSPITGPAESYPLRGAPQVSEGPWQAGFRSIGIGSAYVAKLQTELTRMMADSLGFGPGKLDDGITAVVNTEARPTFFDETGNIVQTRLAPRTFAEGDTDADLLTGRIDNSVKETLRDAAKGVSLSLTVPNDPNVERALYGVVDTMTSVLPDFPGKEKMKMDFTRDYIDTYGPWVGLAGDVVFDPFMLSELLTVPVKAAGKAASVTTKLAGAAARTTKVGTQMLDEIATVGDDIVTEFSKQAYDIFPYEEILRATYEAAPPNMAKIVATIESGGALTRPQKRAAVLYAGDEETVARIRTGLFGGTGGRPVMQVGDEFLDTLDLKKRQKFIVDAVGELNAIYEKAAKMTASEVAAFRDELTKGQHWSEGLALWGMRPEEYAEYAVENAGKLSPAEVAADLFGIKNFAQQDAVQAMSDYYKRVIPVKAYSANEFFQEEFLRAGNVGDNLATAWDVVSNQRNIDKFTALTGIRISGTKIAAASVSEGEILLRAQAQARETLMTAAKQNPGISATRVALSTLRLVDSIPGTVTIHGMFDRMALDMNKLLFGDARFKAFEDFTKTNRKTYANKAPVEALESLLFDFARSQNLKLSVNDVVQAVQTQLTKQSMAYADDTKAFRPFDPGILATARPGLSTDVVASEGLALSMGRTLQQRTVRFIETLPSGTGAYTPSLSDINRWVELIVTGVSTVYTSRAGAGAWAKAIDDTLKGVPMPSVEVPKFVSGQFDSARAMYTSDDITREFLWRVDPGVRMWMTNRILPGSETFTNKLGKKLDSVLREATFRTEYEYNILNRMGPQDAVVAAENAARGMSVNIPPGLNPSALNMLAIQFGENVIRSLHLASKVVQHRQAAARLAILKNAYDRRQDPGNIYGDSGKLGFLVGRDEETQYLLTIPTTSAVTNGLRAYQKAVNLLEGYGTAGDVRKAIFEVATAATPAETDVALDKSNLAVAFALTAANQYDGGLEGMVNFLQLRPVMPPDERTAGLLSNKTAWNSLPQDPTTIAIKGNVEGTYYVFKPSEFSAAILEVIALFPSEGTMRLLLDVANTIDAGSPINVGALASEKPVLDALMIMMNAGLVRSDKATIRQIQAAREKYVTASAEVEPE